MNKYKVTKSNHPRIDRNGELPPDDGSGYILPTASTSEKGGVKVGSNLYMDGDKLNAFDTIYDDIEIKESIESVDRDVVALEAQLNSKQNNLISGINIKTINLQDILGSGNVTIDNGEPGEDGFSPTIAVVETSQGYDITLTDATHSEVVHLKNGTDGNPGKDGESIIGPPGINGVSPTVSAIETPQGYDITLVDVDHTETISLKNGANGRDGADGEQGPPGKDGEQGIQGPAGEQGPKGDTGAPGEQGIQGPAGKDGAQGPKGDTGATGEQGIQGPPGEQGPKGDTGATGEQGIQGPIGETGPAGEQGPEGPEGPTGEQGPEGPEGPAGKIGPRGYNGIDGEAGENFEWKRTMTNFTMPEAGSTVSIRCQEIVTHLYPVSSVIFVENAGFFRIDSYSPDYFWLRTTCLEYVGNAAPGTNIDYGQLIVIAGAPGPTGEQGPQGIQGPKGDTGPQGPKGDTGPSGTAGISIKIIPINVTIPAYSAKFGTISPGTMTGYKPAFIAGFTTGNIDVVPCAFRLLNNNTEIDYAFRNLNSKQQSINAQVYVAFTKI